MSTELYREVDRIFLIILENANYDKVMETNYIGNILTPKARLLANHYAITHPSQPNYIAITTGALHGVHNDSDVIVDSRNIVDILEEGGRSWISYQEDYDAQHAFEAQLGRYVRKHNPFISLKNIQTNADRFSKIVNANQLQGDIDAGTVPDYVWYTPNLDNDGHDTGVEYASNWLEGFLEPLLANPLFNKTVFVITFDENEEHNDNDRNRIWSVLVGDPVAKGTIDLAFYNHYSHLAFVEKMFGLESLKAGDAQANPYTLS
ncbi:hypothetical protein HDV06_000299 [Boothiomyces sp. JEL0866]|nr:hypothetical protein HDV06_000299 [Boothiomyces sp. JEL0866]